MADQNPHDNASRTSSRFGPYLILRQLGRNNMGDLFEAEDTVRDRIVALRLITAGLSGDPQFRRRFARQMHSAGMLQDPHIPPINDYGEIDGRLFVAMRFVDGTDLRTLLNRFGSMAPNRAVSIIRQVAAALDDAHAHGMTHLDLQPKSVLIAGDNRLYLADLAVGNELSGSAALTDPGLTVGSISYAAPERFTDGVVGYSTDIYALACMLYECLTGSPPYPADDVPSVIESHLRQPIPKPSHQRPGIPASFDRVIARGMAKRQGERYLRASDLARAADDALRRADQDDPETVPLRRTDVQRPTAMPPTSAFPTSKPDPSLAAQRPPPPPPSASPRPAKPVEHPDQGAGGYGHSPSPYGQSYRPPPPPQRREEPQVYSPAPGYGGGYGYAGGQQYGQQPAGQYGQPGPSQIGRPASGPPPAPAEPPPRRLLADITANGELQRKSLMPNTLHQVEVRIAIPAADDQGPIFDDSAIPVTDTPAELLVDVSSSDGTVHGTAPLLLSMIDRTLSSTVAVVEFTTGPEGSNVQLEITVLYKNNPIQRALLIATVRSRRALFDRISLSAIPLSTSPEPRDNMRATDAALQYTGISLKRIGTAQLLEIPLQDIDAITDAFEQTASRVLGNDRAPDALADPAAVRLLIDLARSGTLFASMLRDLDLTDANTIAMEVRYNARTVPLELAYDGVAPDQGAQLCGCVMGSKPPPAPGTSHASTRIVCPYSFWGMNRVIARTIAGEPVKKIKLQRPQRAPLSLRPILYGAADKADAMSAPGHMPSHMLQQALMQRAGPAGCTRVTSWRQWCQAVKGSKPQLLVVLGHTEEHRGEANLVIGPKSTLRQASIALKHIGALDVPAPVILLFACSSALAGNVFGALPGTLVDKGAGAVIASMTKFRGSHAAAAADAVIAAMHAPGPAGLTLASALTQARRQLVSRGLLIGLLLVAHGEIDIEFTGGP